MSELVAFLGSVWMALMVVAIGMVLLRRRDLDTKARAGCTWCGHESHAPGPCPRSIQTGTTTAPDVVPCPCARRAARSHHPAGIRTTGGRWLRGVE